MADQAPHNGLYSPAEAAEVLGLGHRRILQMLHRGELQGHQDQHGRWQIPATHVEQLRERREREKKRKPTPPKPTSTPAPELVEALKDQIDTLKEQLAAERDANRENRRIIAALTSRIPELEAPASQDPSESPTRPGPTHSPTQAHEGAQTASERVSEPSERPWWRRLFEA